jgi:type VI secretion system protein ImpA
MSLIDVEALLKEVSPELPCGEDLGYDAAYVELERMAQGTPEQQVGDTIVPAEEPDWRAVLNRCVELLGRSKNLRLGIFLSLALVRLDGIGGLRDGLAVLRGMVERYWDTVYPHLDPEDNNDPLERMNILASLAPQGGGYQDPMSFLRRIRETPLCRSVQWGRFSLRDISIAKGEIAAPMVAGKPPDIAVIDTAFGDTDPEELKTIAQAAADAIAQVQEMDRIVIEKVGAGKAPDVSEFIGMLQEVHRTVQDHLARRGLAEAPAAQPGAAQAGAGGGAPLSGEIRSPQEVILAIDKICQYYERCEPSSPVPLLMRRAQKLVSKGFVDIIRDLTPEALRQIELIGGVDSTAQKK